MFKPSGVHTMTYPNGETHLEREERSYSERQARLMSFITSPEVRETMKVLCRDVIDEEMKRRVTE